MNASTTGMVVDLQRARRQRRLEMYRVRVDERLRANRAALESLFQREELFSPQGSRKGRVLLRARPLWQRASGLLEELSGEGPVPAPRRPENIDALYGEVERLLARGDALARRHLEAAGGVPGPGA